MMLTMICSMDMVGSSDTRLSGVTLTSGSDSICVSAAVKIFIDMALAGFALAISSICEISMLSCSSSIMAAKPTKLSALTGGFSANMP